MPRAFGTSIVLPADPTVAMEAATKQYIDNSLVPYARIQVPTLVQSGNYTASMNQIVMADASGGSITITLPLISGGGRISVKKVDTSANAVNVVPSGSNTIGSMAATTVPVRYQDQTTTFQANSATSPANWVIPYNHLSPASLAAIYAPLASPTFTGTVTVPAPSNATDATTKNYVDTADATKAPTASPTFTGTVTVPNPPVNATDASPKDYVDAVTRGTWNPSDHSLVAWTDDVAYATTTVSFAANGTMLIAALKVATTFTSTNVVYSIATAGATLTSARNYIGIYSTAGALLAQTADLSTVWTSTGNKQTAWTSAVSLTPGTYYLGAISTGTTRPVLMAMPTSALGIQFGRGSTSNVRAYSAGNTYTALPATRPAPTSSSGQYTWFGLY